MQGFKEFLEEDINDDTKFTTSSGSSYSFSSKRKNSVRTSNGEQKDRSIRTVFMKPEHADAMSKAHERGAPFSKFVPHPSKPGHAAVVHQGEVKAEAPYSDTPKVGMVPVSQHSPNMGRGAEKTHFGSPIKQIMNS